MNISDLLDAAETHLSKGRDAAAQKLYTEALTHPGAAARAAGGLGTIALRAGDVDRAQDLFGRGLALAPENAELLVGLAAVHLASQREDAAETCLRRAMRLDPESATAPAGLVPVLVSRGDLEDAHALARRAMALAPDSPDTITTLANVEMVRGNFTDACALFERAAALAPDRADALANLGVLFRTTGELAKAVEVLERARLREPDAPAVLVRLAECKTALGEFEAARDLVRQAVAVAPADGEVRSAEGMVLLHSGCYAEALSALRLAAQYDPQSPTPLINLALLMRRSHQMEAAMEAARQAIAVGGQVHEDARRVEIDLLCLTGRWREAWRRQDEMWFGGLESGDGVVLPDEGIADFGSRVALMVHDLSASLMALRLLPRLATGERRIRLLCLPAFASFFRSLPGIDRVDGREAISLSRDIETAETPLVLDDLPRLMRATPAHLAEPGLGLERDPPASDVGSASPGPAGVPTVGLWWEDAPGGPDPQMLLSALPGVPGLLRGPDPARTLVLPDGRAPTVLIDRGVEHLVDMVHVLLSLDLVVAVDGAVAHLAANLGCRTAVICQTDVPWYWQSCGPRRERWYPTARAVARDPGGLWSTLTEVCEDLLSGTDPCSDTTAPVHA